MAYSSTNAWSIINVMRKTGATTRASVLAAWIEAETTAGTPVIPTSDNVDDGLSYLTLSGFVTFDGTNITPIHTDSSGKPARLRRVIGDETNLEILPNGATPTDGT